MHQGPQLSVLDLLPVLFLTLVPVENRNQKHLMAFTIWPSLNIYEIIIFLIFAFLVTKKIVDEG